MAIDASSTGFIAIAVFLTLVGLVAALLTFARRFQKVPPD